MKMRNILYFVLLIIIVGCASPNKPQPTSTATDMASLKAMPLDEARHILEQHAKQRWQAVELEEKKELERTCARLKELNEGKPANQRNILSDEQKRIKADFQTFEKAKKEELRRIRRELHAQIAELKGEKAEPRFEGLSPVPAELSQP